MILRSHKAITSNLPVRKRLAFLSAGVGLSLGAAALTAAFFMPPAFPVHRYPVPPPLSVPALDPVEALTAADLPNPQSPLSVIQARKKGVPFILIEGGVAQTRRSALRCGVSALVQQAGAQAGVNGTFFADASVQGTDNVLIGPSLCGDETQAVFNPADNNAALAGRPISASFAGKDAHSAV